MAFSDKNLSSLVHITEFPEAIINPEPHIKEESELIMERYLSPDKLTAITGQKKLGNVTYIELLIDTTEHTLGNFGGYLPSLTELKLNGSTLSSIRDIGTGFENLCVLWVSKCDLLDLDGISSLTNLRELYAAYNHLFELSPLSMIDGLQVLDLEGNEIDDVSQVAYLSLLQSLESVNLFNNPVCLAPRHNNDPTEIYDYRTFVKNILPNISTLDDYPVEMKTTELLQEAPITEDTMLVTDSIKQYIDSSTLDAPLNTRPGSGTRMKTAFVRRPYSGRPTTTASSGYSSLEPTPRSGASTSRLTTGKAICGNPIRSLKDRRKLEDVSFKAEKSFTEENCIKTEDVLEELKLWRIDHERKQRAKQDAPDILTIIETPESDLTPQPHSTPPSDDYWELQDIEETEKSSRPSSSKSTSSAIERELERLNITTLPISAPKELPPVVTRRRPQYIVPNTKNLKTIQIEEPEHVGLNWRRPVSARAALQPNTRYEL